MGLDRTVRFPAGELPAWDLIKSHLARLGEPAPLRMIDGQLAFEDEVPEPGWRELRVSVGPGMVTVRRSGDSVTCVVWSNADAALLAARDQVAWACAAAGGGAVVTESGPLPAPAFAQVSDIRPA